MSARDDALALLGLLRLEDGTCWGTVANAVQWEDAERVLDPESSRPYGLATRARGYDKTGGAAGMAAAVMLTQLAPASHTYYLAADRDQGRLAIDSVAGYVARTPEIAGALVVDAFKVRAPRTGCVLEVLPADVAGSFGLRPAFLIVDELAQWAETEGPRRLFDATTSALAKVPGARCLVITTAGDPSHWSFRVLEHARRDPLWWTHEVTGPPPWADPARLDEQRRRLLPSVYARLFENQWTASEDSLVSAEDLAACVAHDGPVEPRPGVIYRIGLDVGLRSDRTAIAVAHRETSGRVVLDRVIVLAPSAGREVRLDDIEATLWEASRRYNSARIVADPWQSIGLMQRLRDRGLRVEEFNFSATSVGRLAATLHRLLADRTIALPDDPALLTELGRVRLRETSPGVVRMDHVAGQHDDQAIATALACQGLVTQPTRAGVAVSTGHRLMPAHRR